MKESFLLEIVSTSTHFFLSFSELQNLVNLALKNINIDDARDDMTFDKFDDKIFHTHSHEFKSESWLNPWSRKSISHL